MRRLMGRSFVAAVACLFLVVGTTTAANAWSGPEWSEMDPIFDIDGRVVQVAAAVPTEHAGTILHFTLTVSKGSTATWVVPLGQQATVEIIHSKSTARDRAKLVVSAGKDARYPLKVTVEGPGLRNGPIVREGNARGVTVGLRLTGSADQDSNDPDDD